MKQAVVLVAHGTVDDLDELPDFVTRIRRGHAPPLELVAELRRRYEAIGGRSPLNEINGRLAARLAAVLGMPVRVANRLARPFVKDVLEQLARSGVERVVTLPLAQYSGHVYADAVKGAIEELRGEGTHVEAVSARSWGEEPLLLEAYADAIAEALLAIDDRERTTLVLTAHSLPVAAIRGGDPYERDVRAAAAAIVPLVEARVPGPRAKAVVAFQSQGMSPGPGGKPAPWLGPDLLATLDACHAGGDAHVLFAPIGFLADHVEILYDLDIEARLWARERGLAFHRTRSLNDAGALVRALAHVAEPLLGHA